MEEHRENAPRNERRHGLQVPTSRVPVPTALTVVVEVVHFDVTGLDAVVVDDDHAVDRTDEARKHVDRAVDHFGRMEKMPGQNRHGENRRDETAASPGDLRGREVRDVEGGGNEVRDDVHAHGRDEQREAQKERQHLRIELSQELDRVHDEFAEDDGRPRNRDHRDRGEEDEVDRKTPEIAPMHVAVRTAVAREVAEIERRTCKVGDDEGDADHQRPHGFTEAEGLIREREADVLPPGFRDDPDHHDEHHDVDDRSRPVDEDADRPHVGDEERRLRGPHDEETNPTES